MRKQDKIVHLNDKRPHYMVVTLSGYAHVIPAHTIDRIIMGDMEITELEKYQQIIPAIIAQWSNIVKSKN